MFLPHQHCDNRDKKKRIISFFLLFVSVAQGVGNGKVTFRAVYYYSAVWMTNSPEHCAQDGAVRPPGLSSHAKTRERLSIVGEEDLSCPSSKFEDAIASSINVTPRYGSLPILQRDKLPDLANEMLRKEF